MDSDGRRILGVVLFDGFELLDVFGPVELFARLTELFEVHFIGPDERPVRSAQGKKVVTDHPYADAPPADISLVPGGTGTRALAGDAAFGTWLRGWAGSSEIAASVCTGAGLLAAAGLLDGYRATSNKRAFAWVMEQGPNVTWVRKARWVHDRDRWTSGGVAAGMDMSLALIAHLHGEELATRLADAVEYDWHRDSEWDPFAVKHGLVVE